MNSFGARMQAAGFFFSVGVGSLLHFVYDWTGGNPLAAPFAAVNESTWEHMKLLFWPMFAFAWLQWLAGGRDLRCFWQVKLLGMQAGLLLIPLQFYGYNGMFGTSGAWLNIGFFVVAAAVAYALEWHARNMRCGNSWLPLLLLYLQALAFAVFTFLPPQLPLFVSPVWLRCW